MLITPYILFVPFLEAHVVAWQRFFVTVTRDLVVQVLTKFYQQLTLYDVRDFSKELPIHLLDVGNTKIPSKVKKLSRLFKPHDHWKSLERLKPLRIEKLEDLKIPQNTWKELQMLGISNLSIF